MAVRFASLGSGSEGNALLVEVKSGTTTTRVLLDCGFSAKEVERRLARLDVAVDTLDAILITHEHTDHIGSALTLARKRSIPLYMSWGTARATGADAPMCVSFKTRLGRPGKRRYGQRERKGAPCGLSGCLGA